MLISNPAAIRARRGAMSTVRQHPCAGARTFSHAHRNRCTRYSQQARASPSTIDILPVGAEDSEAPSTSTSSSSSFTGSTTITGLSRRQAGLGAAALLALVAGGDTAHATKTVGVRGCAPGRTAAGKAHVRHHGHGIPESISHTEGRAGLCYEGVGSKGMSSGVSRACLVETT